MEVEALRILIWCLLTTACMAQSVVISADKDGNIVGINSRGAGPMEITTTLPSDLVAGGQTREAPTAYRYKIVDGKLVKRPGAEVLAELDTKRGTVEERVEREWSMQGDRLALRCYRLDLLIAATPDPQAKAALQSLRDVVRQDLINAYLKAKDEVKP
jgi:hypothetical protein